jgi:hypothetical protein
MFVITLSCVEEIPLEAESFESILIVEATVTNENKRQEILLSRSYTLGSNQPIYEFLIHLLKTKKADIYHKICSLLKLIETIVYLLQLQTEGNMPRRKNS